MNYPDFWYSYLHIVVSDVLSWLEIIGYHIIQSKYVARWVNLKTRPTAVSSIKPNFDSKLELLHIRSRQQNSWDPTRADILLKVCI